MVGSWPWTWTTPQARPGHPRWSRARPRWSCGEVLNGLYDDLGLNCLGDAAFRALVLARVIEPTSKADTVRVLTEIGVASPHRVTFMRCLKRVVERDYRAVIAQACHRHATRGGSLAVVLYDVTTLHFEIEREDKLRKVGMSVGMSKERRVDPAGAENLVHAGHAARSYS